MTIQTYEDSRKREQQAALAANYREIGCAAVLAAVVAQARRQAEKENAAAAGEHKTSRAA